MLGMQMLPSLPAQCPKGTRPNFLICITDDQSWESVSAGGHPVVSTPTFDRLAREGVWFTQAFATAPSCTPSRASILTGRPAYALEAGSIHNGHLPGHFPTFQELLEQVGYRVGYTGKGLDPAMHTLGGRNRNPAGPAYNVFHLGKPNAPPAGISSIDYVANFEFFLKNREPGQPFSFWFGALEPHRGYGGGVGVARGMQPDSVPVPGFLPDISPQLRVELADYYYECQWADMQLGRMLALLERLGELDNTVVIFTSDNGMPYPRAKADVYEHGTHVPLAIRWGQQIPGGRMLTDYVSLAELAPTILDAAGVAIPTRMTTRSLMPLLRSPQSGLVDPARTFMVAGHERHGELGYHPHRAIYTDEFIYIYNVEAGRHYPEPDTPALAAHLLEQMKGVLIMPHLLRKFRTHPDIAAYWQRYRGDRPAHELYDRQKDPWQWHNLAEDPAYAKARAALAAQMWAYAAQTGDPRATAADTDVFATYTFYGRAWQNTHSDLVQKERKTLGTYGGAEGPAGQVPPGPPENLSFRDLSGLPGQILGTLSWDLPAAGKGVTYYRLMLLDRAGQPMLAPLADICAGQGQWSFPMPVAIPVEAAWLGLYAGNACGLSKQAAMVPLVPASAASVRVFPNPSPGPLTLDLNLSRPMALHLRLRHPSGQVVWDEWLDYSAKQRYYELDPPALPGGVYYLYLEGKGTSLIKKVVLR